MHHRFVPALIAAFAFAATVGGDAIAQELRTSPRGEVLEGEPVAIVADGLQPGEEVTLRAERWYAPLSTAAKPPRLFRAEARFRADARGRIDSTASASLGGSYVGVDARGMFWSMTPLDDPRSVPHEANTREVRLSLTRAQGHSLECSVRLLAASREVVVETVDALPGATFASLPGDDAKPALIVLGGSEGGASIGAAAAPFASHGFAVLALPYFAPERDVAGLPEAMVEQPLEYLASAYRWLTRKAGVDASRVGLHGTSLGATYALLGATRFAWVDAVVASVPSDVVIDGWGPGIAEGTRSAFSWRGEPLPFVPSMGYDAEMQRDEIHVRRVYERGRAAFPERAVRARIPVETIRGAVMVIGAYDDQMWPSGMMAQNLAERRLEAGLAVSAHLYPDAGHALYPTGYDPTTTYGQRRQKVGGTPAANAMAQADAWQSTLRFLRRELRVPRVERDRRSSTVTQESRAAASGATGDGN
jgi:dienelactone hydrolase